MEKTTKRFIYKQTILHLSFIRLQFNETVASVFYWSKQRKCCDDEDFSAFPALFEIYENFDIHSNFALQLAD